MGHKGVSIGTAMQSHSSEKSVDCESVLDPMGEDFIMKGPQLIEQQPCLHGALSVAGLIAALCLLAQVRLCPAWNVFLCGNQITRRFSSHFSTPKSDLWSRPRISLCQAEVQGSGLATTAQHMTQLLQPPWQGTWYPVPKLNWPPWQIGCVSVAAIGLP